LEPTTYTYDARGQLTEVTEGAGPVAPRTRHFSYDAGGRLGSLVDPVGGTVTFTSDSIGRITTQTLPGVGTVAYGYDANGMLNSIAPPGRTAHVFGYSAVDLEASYTPPNLLSGTTPTGYTYNTDRQLARVTRPDATTLDLAYDTAGRPSSLTLPRGVIGATYDPAGRVAGLSAPVGLGLAYTFDGGLLTSTVFSGTVAGTVGRTYDSSFRVVSLSVNGANPVSFAYDADGALTQAGGFSLTRNLQHGRLSGTMLGVVTDAFTYNGFGELSSFAASTSGIPQLNVQYTRDALGRIITQAETLGGVTDTYAYTYDPAGRLTSVQKNGLSVEGYTYDANGNRLSAIGPGGATNGAYDAQDRLTQYGASTFTFTAAGELATRTAGNQTTTYSYDQMGNLLGASLPSGSSITYLVDGQQRRIGKQVNGSLVQGFLYQNHLRPIAELDSSGAVVSQFVYATRANVPDYLIKGGATYRMLTDHRGSPRLVVNTTTGAVAQRMDYDSFGNVLIDTNPGFQPFGFAGGLYDRDTKLVGFGARDYDAETGRWMAKDPLGFAGGQANLYAYVNSDPLNRVDPSGLCPGDYKKCRDKFLDNYFGEESRRLADLFSLQSLIGQNGSDIRKEYLESALEVGLLKGGSLVALDALARTLVAAGAQGTATSPWVDAKLVSGGLWAQQGIHLLEAGAATFGVGIFAVTTTMEVLATSECWDAQF
jgi:RHS repeat-associated protein